MRMRTRYLHGNSSPSDEGSSLHKNVYLFICVMDDSSK